MHEQILQRQQAKLVHWPTPQDYNEALQSPATSFGDPELQPGRPELSRLGLPRPITGMFASVYRLRCGDRDWAVRCFLHNFPDQQQRYELIEDHLRAANLPSTVGFDFQAEGLRLFGRWYPILKMEWCEGETLNVFVEKNLKRPDRLIRLADSFQAMVAELRSKGIAHGDLQHGNIMVRQGELVLVDYDGMYVPNLAPFDSNEIGHRSYQHPGRSQRHFDAEVDNFSAWLIHASLRALAIDPHLFHRLGGGDECLLLRSSDLEEPSFSEAFEVLENHPSLEIRQSFRRIRYFLTLPVERVPPLGAPVAVPADLPAVASQTQIPEWMQEHLRAGFRGGRELARQPEMPGGTGQQGQRFQSAGTKGKRGRKRAQQPQSSGPGSSSAAAGRQGQSRRTPKPSAAIASKYASGGSGSYATTPSRTGKTPLLFTILAYVFIALALIGAMRDIYLNITEPQRPAAQQPTQPVAETRTTVEFNDKGESDLLVTANTYYVNREYGSAERFYNRVTQRFYGEDDYRAQINLASAYNNLGNIYIMRQKYDTAEGYYSDAVSRWKEASIMDPAAARLPQAVATSNMALCQYFLKDYKGAAHSYEQAMRLLDEDPTPPMEVEKQVVEGYYRTLKALGAKDARTRTVLERLEQIRAQWQSSGARP